MNSSKNIILLKIFNLITISIIFYFSIIKISNIPIETANLPSDKILHIGAYFVLSLSTILARWEIISTKKNSNLRKNRENIQKYSIVIIFCLIYGIMIEIIQSAVPSRNFDILDIITNGLGILAGILTHLVGLVLIKRFNKPS